MTAQYPVAKPPTKRRWLRYSLRTLFVLMTLACIAFAWFGYRLHQARQQALAVKRVEELGGLVVYDYLYDYEWVHRLEPPVKHEFDFAQQKFVSTPRTPPPDPPGPDWLREHLGIDFFAHVVVIELQDPFNAAPENLTHDADLSLVKSLPELRVLSLSCPEITDEGLASLAHLSRLEHLDVGVSKVTGKGLKHLEGLRKLAHLNVTRTQVNDASVESLLVLDQLNTLDLSDTQITDAGLLLLRKLPQLRELNLGYTKVTYPGLSNFLDARPTVQVTWPRYDASASGAK